AERARALGAVIETGQRVDRLRVDGGRVRGVVLASGEEIAADVVVCNADPFRMRDLVGKEALPAEYNQRLDGYARPGSTFHVNLALKGLPKFTCLPEDRGQYGP